MAMEAGFPAITPATTLVNHGNAVLTSHGQMIGIMSRAISAQNPATIATTIAATKMRIRAYSTSP